MTYNFVHTFLWILRNKLRNPNYPRTQANRIVFQYKMTAEEWNEFYVEIPGGPIEGSPKSYERPAVPFRFRECEEARIRRAQGVVYGVQERVTNKNLWLRKRAGGAKDPLSLYCL